MGEPGVQGYDPQPYVMVSDLFSWCLGVRLFGWQVTLNLFIPFMQFLRGKFLDQELTSCLGLHHACPSQMPFPHSRLLATNERRSPGSPRIPLARCACAVALRSVAFVGAIYCWNARQDLGERHGCSMLLNVAHLHICHPLGIVNLHNFKEQSREGLGYIQGNVGVVANCILLPFLLFKFQPTIYPSGIHYHCWFCGPGFTMARWLYPWFIGVYRNCMGQLKQNIPIKSRRQSFFACSATPYHWQSAWFESGPRSDAPIRFYQIEQASW